MAVSYKRRNKSFNRPKHFVNHRIKAKEVRLIGAEGENVGVVPTHEAMKRAQDAEMDLVLISEKAVPPVARILVYSKFLYDERKKQSASKAKSQKSETKEFIFGPSIGDGDLKMRIERTREFLEAGNRVKMTVRLRGRQRAHPEIGLEKIRYAVKMLEDVARIEEKDVRLRGIFITVTFVKK